MKRCHLFAWVPVLLMLLGATTNARAQQCVNPITPNCDFYPRCMEATCKCGYANSGYALSYGLKYCRRFLGYTDLTPAGSDWRDATLRCLQEKLVAQLPTTPALCNCDQLRSEAYSTHLACYTQTGHSICDLPASDVLKIKDIVDLSDLQDKEGPKAVVEVAGTCLASNPTNAWQIVKAYAAQKLGNP